MGASSRISLVAALLAVSIASASAAPPTASRTPAITNRIVYRYATDQSTPFHERAPATVTYLYAPP